MVKNSGITSMEMDGPTLLVCHSEGATSYDLPLDDRVFGVLVKSIAYLAVLSSLDDHPLASSLLGSL